MASDYMLRKMHEKKENLKDEAYYAQTIEELKKKNAHVAKPAFVVQHGDGMVEVWSSDSEDEEVRRPSHGKCLMVENTLSSDSCFATKPLS